MRVALPAVLVVLLTAGCGGEDEPQAEVTSSGSRVETVAPFDPAADTALKLSELPGDTPERLVLAAGSLWATGRGTDLLRVDPATGETQETIEIGAGGIDVVATDDAIWVAVVEPEADQQGLPVLERLVSVDPPTGELCAEHVPTDAVNATGLAAEGEVVWIADVVAGVLSRLETG